MTKRTTLILIGILIVIGVAGLAAWNRGATVAQENEPVTSQDAGRKMAFSDLVKQGGTHTCSVVQNVNGAETRGMTYVHQGNLRGEFTSVYEGKDIVVSFIVQDGYTYLWNTLMKQGFKFKNQTGGTTSTTTLTASPEVYLSTITDYTCDEWTYDASKFNLPAGITFEEVK